MRDGVVRLERLARTRHQLSLHFSLDGMQFQTAYWYGDVDLPALEERYGREYLEKVYFHIMAFEANKLFSLSPTLFDFGDYARFLTPAFQTLWQTILHRVWAQWRFENGRPDHPAPGFAGHPSTAAVGPVAVAPGPVDHLYFVGGGKDSLLGMKLLDEAGISYGSLAYSNSIYGAAAPQHRLIDQVLDHGHPERRHRQWIQDSFLDAPILDLHPEYPTRQITAAETPSSVFGALPIALQHGYRHLVVAHERSANRGNLVWDATGEDVNHQWGKSLAAERLIGDYIARELVENLGYYSVLGPIYDVVIFNLLRRYADGVPAAHSCNVRKPWCMRCAKCAYVWLNYMAWLPVDLVNRIFDHTNLFDLEENQVHYEQLLGLTEHIPFECIGQVPESRLAFELCRRKGLTGRAMDLYRSRFPALDVEPILAQFLDVVPDQANLPPAVASALLPLMVAGAEEARRYVAAPSSTAAPC
jgi:hypothetical protein